MKRLYILFFLLNSLLIVSQNNYKNEIKSDFLKYNSLIVQKKFSQAMDYVLPDFFEIFPKNQMIKIMETTFNSPDLTFELETPIIESIEDKIKVEDRYYSQIKYSNLMKLKISSNEIEDEDEDEKKMRINITVLAYEKTFGKGNVLYNNETDFFEINAHKTAFAISNNGEDDWKYVVAEKRQKLILSKILPEEIVNKI